MIVAGGKGEEIPGLDTVGFLEDSSLRLGRDDYAPRTARWIRSVIFHTTIGDWPFVLLHGAREPGGAHETIDYWRRDPAHAGAHLVVDYDGSVFCCADLLWDAAYHATTINQVSIGVELKQQHTDGGIFQATLDAGVELADWLTRRFGIQRQVHGPYSGPVDRLAAGGADCVGVFGHRDQTGRRGRGDPGDYIYDALLGAGYDRFDFRRAVDRDVWRDRQASIGVATSQQDGVPGPATVTALRHADHPMGLWISRPGDES